MKITSRQKIVIGGCLLSFLVAVYIWVPKKDFFGDTGKQTAYYRGAGFHSQPGLFGKNYYQFEILFPNSSTSCVVKLKTNGTNHFRQLYPDGSLHWEGESFFYFPIYDNQLDLIPDIMLEQIEWMDCYQPDGILESQVNNGTGTFTMWYDSGTKY